MAKRKRKVNKLSKWQFGRLKGWLNKLDFDRRTDIDTAKGAKKALGFKVTKNNVKGAREKIGVFRNKGGRIIEDKRDSDSKAAAVPKSPVKGIASRLRNLEEKINILDGKIDKLFAVWS